jgi:recombination protein RecA
MAKKTEKKLEVNSKTQEALDKLNKKYGEGTVLSLSHKSTDGYDVISTGSIGFDYIGLGVGGFVKGKLYELIGWEGSGKSTICGHAVANCQKQGGKAVYIDGEHSVDKAYFKAIGVNVDDMLIAQPSCGEEGFQIAEELIKTGEFDLVIIDSDSSLIPKSVIDGEIGDSSIGKKARLNNGAYPKLKSLLADHKTCMIVVSQWREKIGMMFGDSRITQGGHALKFYTDCRIDVSKSFIKEGDETIGSNTKIKVIKNKMAPPFRASSFEVRFGKGIDKLGEIMQLASDFEIIKKWGKIITWGEDKYPEEDFRQMLNNPDFFNKMKDEIVIKIKNVELPIEETIEE